MVQRIQLPAVAGVSGRIPPLSRRNSNHPARDEAIKDLVGWLDAIVVV